MEITYNDFVRVVPSAMMPDETLFSAMQGFVDDSCRRVRQFLGAELYDSISAVDPNLTVLETDREGTLAQACVRYICARAYYEASAHLDLVLTATGFGVVNNDNVVPASADRVKALRDRLSRQMSDYYDEIKAAARYFDTWTTPANIRIYFASLFWCARHLRRLGIAEPTQGDLIERRPAIMSAEAKLRALISSELFAALCKTEATASTTEVEAEAIDLCRDYIADIVCSQPHADIVVVRDRLLAHLEANISDFPAYAASANYKANHFDNYQNEKDDTCYFFG